MFILFDTVSDKMTISTVFNIHFGSPESVVEESICLIHSGEPNDTRSGHLCLKDVPIIYKNFDLDVNSYQGIVGLA